MSRNRRFHLISNVIWIWNNATKKWIEGNMYQIINPKYLTFSIQNAVTVDISENRKPDKIIEALDDTRVHLIKEILPNAKAGAKIVWEVKNKKVYIVTDDHELAMIIRLSL